MLHHKRIRGGREDEEEDYLMVAHTYGVNRLTAKGIVARCIREGRTQERPRGGRNNVRVDDEMSDCLDEIISQSCLLTLSRVTVNGGDGYHSNSRSIPHCRKDIVRYAD